MSEETVVEFPGRTRPETPIPKVLATAAGKGLTDVVVIGWDAKGEFYYVSSYPPGADALWLIENARFEVMMAARRE